MAHAGPQSVLWPLLVAIAVASRPSTDASGSFVTPKPACRCASSQEWCSPLSTPPPEHEIYAFAVANYAGEAGGAGGVEPSAAATTTQQWPHFNWDIVTTVAWDVGANETVCFAGGTTF